MLVQSLRIVLSLMCALCFAACGGGDDAAGDDDGAADAATPTVDAAPLSPLGAACGQAGECDSGFCADGVCCETACDQGCFACAAALTGGADGACAAATAGSDPHDACDASGCATGECDGAGACAAAPAGSECRAVAGDCDVAEVCDGVNLDCPSDELVVGGTTCRLAAGDCDVAEQCNGSDAACPADKLLDTSAVCDGTYRCDGAQAVCPSACIADTGCAAGAFCTTAFSCLAGKRVFTTSTTHNGNLGGVAGGDAICQARATEAGFAGSFKAWLGDGTPEGAPLARFTQSTVPWYLPNGIKIADDWADLTDGIIDGNINVSDLGVAVAPNIPWSGVDPSGGVITMPPGGPTCSGWTTVAGNGSYGSSTTASSAWTQSGAGACTVLHRLYCFQQ